MNKYRFEGPLCYMEIVSPKHGKFEVIIDTEDFPRVQNIEWFAIKSGINIYCVGHIGFGVKRYFTRMHRLIMSYPDSLIDHKNGNGLDNRKINLRNATYSQNNMNKKPYRDGLPKGVRKTKNGKRYEASIGFNKKIYFLGVFDSEKGASDAYDSHAISLFGEFYRSNIT